MKGGVERTGYRLDGGNELVHACSSALFPMELFLMIGKELQPRAERPTTTEAQYSEKCEMMLLKR